MSNSQILSSSLQAGEELVRMMVISPNGAYFIPAQGYIRPANVPTNLMGLVLVNFYDSEGRELRNRVPIMLLATAHRMDSSQYHSRCCRRLRRRSR